MDQPKASSSKRAAARALHVNMRKYYLFRWLHRSGVVRQETEERVGPLLEIQKAKQKKQEIKKRRDSTVINTLWNEHSRGHTNRGDGSEMVRCPCKGGEGYWNPTVVVEENTI